MNDHIQHSLKIQQIFVLEEHNWFIDRDDWYNKSFWYILFHQEPILTFILVALGIFNIASKDWFD
jgi:hypothetical protein